MKHTFKKVLLSLAVVAVCSSLQFTSCKKKGKDVYLPPTQIEIQALKDFYKATNGDTWTKKWDTTQNDISKWYGVELGEYFTGGIGEIQQTIKAIKLPNNNLKGTIPASFGDLTRLEELDLSNNTLGGTIPSSFSTLSYLTLLNLSNNILGGEIPASLDNLNVRILNLSNNNFTGNINSLFSNYGASFSYIKNIDITNNLFSGHFPFTLVENIAKNNKITLDENATDINGYLAPVLPFIKLCPQKGNSNLTGGDCFQ